MRAVRTSSGPFSRPPRIALLDCYTGSNLGDAAILDSAILSLRARVPDVRLSGISLSNYNMQSRHGIHGIALCCTPLSFYAMSNWTGGPADAPTYGVSENRRSSLRQRLKAVIPARAWMALKGFCMLVGTVPREVRHFIHACRELRNHDLLVVCGGGQIDDEWGGAWGHPYALFKWSIAARLTSTPIAITSVGSSRLHHRLSRFFFGEALRAAAYRSFRDEESRAIVGEFLPGARDDNIVPDLAFALASGHEPASGVLPQSDGRRVVAISPIAFARPDSWPTPDAAVYRRYVQMMRTLIVRLLDREYFLLFVWSSMPDDVVALTEILEGFDQDTRARLHTQSEMASIEHGRWQDLAAALQAADIVVASRLHSVILSLVVGNPVVAISFDPKVDRIMREFGDTQNLLDIRSFSADEVLNRVEIIDKALEDHVSRVKAFVNGVKGRLSEQFDRLVALSRFHLAAVTNSGSRCPSVADSGAQDHSADR